MDAALDRGIGRVLDTVRRYGLEENTLLFFINDNGGATNNGSDNGPLRGMKGSKWEGGIRVPFMVKWPAQLAAGRTCDQPVISLDIFPTCVAAAGGSLARHPDLDGVNLLPLLQGSEQKPPHEFLFWRRGVAAAVRHGQWKLIRSETNPTLLFNLEQDLGETHDLADRHPEIVKRLTDALSKWEQQLAPPRWREGEPWRTNQILKHQMQVAGREMERKYP